MAYILRGVRSPRRTFEFVLAACVILSAAALLAAPALAAEGKPPVIVSTGWGVGGEVEAEINPEGLETSYEIKLECQICGPAGYSPSVGQLPAVSEARTVSLNLTGIQPGSYWFDVLATSSAGEAFRRSELKVLPIPPGACPYGCHTNKPYEAEVSEASRESAARIAAIISAEVEAKRRQQAREHEEQKANEAAASYAAEVAALKKREEEEAADKPTPICTVPSLRGDTLRAARRTLTKAHCRLGRVHRPAHPAKTLLIVRQDLRRGTKLPGGAAVAVTLGLTSRARPPRSA